MFILQATVALVCVGFIPEDPLGLSQEYIRSFDLSAARLHDYVPGILYASAVAVMVWARGESNRQNQHAIGAQPQTHWIDPSIQILFWLIVLSPEELILQRIWKAIGHTTRVAVPIPENFTLVSFLATCLSNVVHPDGESIHRLHAQLNDGLSAASPKRNDYGAPAHPSNPSNVRTPQTMSSLLADQHEDKKPETDQKPKTYVSCGKQSGTGTPRRTGPTTRSMQAGPTRMAMLLRVFIYNSRFEELKTGQSGGGRVRVDDYAGFCDAVGKFNERSTDYDGNAAEKKKAHVAICKSYGINEGLLSTNLVKLQKMLEEGAAV